MIPHLSISALSLVVGYLVQQVLLLRTIPVGVGGIEPKILVEFLIKINRKKEGDYGKQNKDKRF